MNGLAVDVDEVTCQLLLGYNQFVHREFGLPFIDLEDVFEYNYSIFLLRFNCKLCRGTTL